MTDPLNISFDDFQLSIYSTKALFQYVVALKYRWIWFFSDCTPSIQITNNSKKYKYKIQI